MKSDPTMKETQRSLTPIPIPVRNIPLIVAVLSFCGFLIRFQVFMAIPLVPVVSQAFNVSGLSAAWVGSAYSFTYAAGFLLFAPLSDRFGRRKIVVSGLLALIPLTFAAGTSPSFAVLILFRALQGFAGATFVPTALAYISEILSPSVRPIGLACMTTGLLLSGIIAQLYSSTIALNYGWRWVFWILAIVYTIFALIITTQIPQDDQPRSKTSILVVYKNMAALLKRRSLVVVYLAGFTMFFSFMAMYSGLGPYLTKNHGLDQNGLFLVRLAGAPGILLSPISGKLAQRWGSKKVAMGGLTLAIVGLALEPMTSSLPLLVMATVVFVTGIAMTSPSLISLVSTIAEDAKGSGQAIHSFVLFTGASFAPLIVQLTRSVGFTGLCIGLISLLLVGLMSLTLGCQIRLAK
jgi:MFS transporter, YNFM family, putative membrane transport protein